MDKRLVFEIVCKALTQYLQNEKITYANCWEAHQTIYDALKNYQPTCPLPQTQRPQ